MTATGNYLLPRSKVARNKANVAPVSMTTIEVRTPLPNMIKPGTRALLTRVGDTLAEQGITAYAVGGLVRDSLLGRDTADIDIVVNVDAPKAAQMVADALQGKCTLLDDINRISRVVLSRTRAQYQLDFATLEGNIEQDLARRDFTIDAMAFCISRPGKSLPEAPIIDPLHGIDDLHQKVLRAVTKTVFKADAARLLRGVRLAAEIGFTIDKGTESLIKLDSPLIAQVAGERVREELVRLLNLTGQHLFHLDELGLLAAIFPEMNATRGVKQPREHYWDVFNHSLMTVAAVDFLLRKGDWEYADKETLLPAPWSAELAEHFDREVSHGSTRRVLLKLAALLHDIAKPDTKSLDKGRIRFLGHASAGAETVAKILGRLRFSSREAGLVETTVRYHLRPGQMSQGEETPSRRAIYRYFRDTGDAGIDTLFFNLADHLATRGPNLEAGRWQEHAQMTTYVLCQYLTQSSTTHPPRLINGQDLIDMLGMSPGPEIGAILEEVREAQASGEITSRKEAISLARRLLNSAQPPEKTKKQINKQTDIGKE